VTGFHSILIVSFGVSLKSKWHLFDNDSKLWGFTESNSHSFHDGGEMRVSLDSTGIHSTAIVNCGASLKATGIYSTMIVNYKGLYIHLIMNVSCGVSSKATGFRSRTIMICGALYWASSICMITIMNCGLSCNALLASF